MKIVDVTEFYSERGGGIRSHLTQRGHVLCQRGHDHTLIASGPRDDFLPRSVGGAPRASFTPERDAERDRPAGQTRVLRVAGPALPYDRTYHLLGRLDKIVPLVRRERPDVLEVHSPYFAAAAVLACGRKAAPVRTVFWHTDHVGTYVEPALARLPTGHAAAAAVARSLGWIIRGLLALFDATFVASVAQAKRLRAAGVGHVTVVPFGVDPRVFHPGARSEAARGELAGAAAAPLLVGVGRFAVEKRWDVVLEAFAHVRSRRPEAVLVLFGDGPERAHLERIAPPGVRFAGFEKDRAKLASVLASADVFVHGCPYETSGLAVAEAVACGAPLVVPDEGGAAEVAEGACSERYRSLDAEACAAAMERLLGRSGPELRAQTLQAASGVPTLDQHFTRVLAVYGELLRANANSRGLERSESSD